MRWSHILALYLFWPAVLLVAWGELTPHPPNLEVEVWDKTLHFMAYFGLAGLATVALGARRPAGTFAAPAAIFLFQILLAPFAGCHTETLFEHGIEQAEMPVAAVIRDVDDFGVRTGEQLPRVQQPQFNLPRAERHAEFLAEQAAEMAFATVKLRGQPGQGTF